MSLAFSVLEELIEELWIRPCPVVFAAFSAGSKACLYKVFQLIEGGCEARIHMLLKRCVSGHIYDSGPLDVTSDFGFRFSIHPSIAKVPGPSKLATWVAKSLVSGLDALYITRLEVLVF
ncbi:hypothetical protein AAHE18_20G136700 [Arachis hypogaea]